MDDDVQPITALLWDVETDQIAIARDQFLWEWIHGDWACDCNRQRYFDIEEIKSTPENLCIGAKRFLVVMVKQLSEISYTLDDFNADYPEEMRQQAKQFQWTSRLKPYLKAQEALMPESDRQRVAQIVSPTSAPPHTLPMPPPENPHRKIIDGAREPRPERMPALPAAFDDAGE